MSASSMLCTFYCQESWWSARDNSNSKEETWGRDLKKDLRGKRKRRESKKRWVKKNWWWKKMKTRTIRRGDEAVTTRGRVWGGGRRRWIWCLEISQWRGWNNHSSRWAISWNQTTWWGHRSFIPLRWWRQIAHSPHLHKS